MPLSSLTAYLQTPALIVSRCCGVGDLFYWSASFYFSKMLGPLARTFEAGLTSSSRVAMSPDLFRALAADPFVRTVEDLDHGPAVEASVGPDLRAMGDLVLGHHHQDPPAGDLAAAVA